MIGNIIVVVNVLLFTISIGKHDNGGEYIMSFANLLLAIIANLLVNGKYINKQARGAK